MATGSIKRPSFITRKFAHEYSINGSGNAQYNLYQDAVAALPGYTPIGIIEFGTGNGVVFAANCLLINSAFGVYLHNTTGSTQTGKFEATVLYQKS